MVGHRLWAVLANPADGIGRDTFVGKYAELHERVAAGAPRTHVRLLQMTGEQLLPNRAAGAHHAYLALYEGPVEEFPSAGVAVPGVSASAADAVWSWVDRADLCVFAGDRIFDTTVPTRLPEGVPPFEYRGPTGGGPGIFWALSNPVSPDVEEEYNRWYDTTHTPDTLMQPGMVRGSRYRRPADVAVTGSDYREQRYLAKYEIDDVAKIPGAREAVEWMAGVSADFRSVTFDGSSVRGFTFYTVGEFGAADRPSDPAQGPLLAS
jgi:hypothetical protein